MIFLDTSAIYAAADRRDTQHDAAVAALDRLLAEGQELLVHNYVLAETAALLQRRLGFGEALTVLSRQDEYRVHWITPDDHRDAVALLRERSRRGLSLVDCASFVVMRRYSVTQALAFDGDFTAEGFEIYRAGGA